VAFFKGQADLTHLRPVAVDDDKLVAGLDKVSYGLGCQLGAPKLLFGVISQGVAAKGNDYL
jgi:hypothetical protein